MNRHPLKLTRLMLFARRAPIDRTPAEVGLAYEDVAFKAGDGVGLKGWFIPSEAEGPAPAIVFVHGWMWNRLGQRRRQGRRSTTATSTSSPPPGRCTTPASTCSCTTSASTARASPAAAW